MKTVNGSRRLLIAGVASIALACAAASASAAPGPHSFNVPPGAFAQAAAAFSAQSGIKIAISAPGAAGAHVNGVSGNYTDEEAFARMLAGSGLSWHRAGDTIVVDGMVEQAPAGDHVLGAVQVEGAQGAFVPADGFGSGAGANGSSDVTATEGTHSLTTNNTVVATKTPQSVKDTPQTVTVITAEQIKQQSLTDVISALQSAPGITVANADFGNGGLQNNVIISRGYEVTSFVVDGGAPLNYQNTGGQTVPDLSEYDHVEILKGSDALFGGAGNPGGVVNLQRKRPLDHEQFVFSGEYGSWNDGRAEFDLTGPIAFDDHLRARADITYQSQDFFYDYAHQNLLHLYGILEADLGPETVLRFGGSYQRQDGTGDDAAGLPRYANGGDIGLSRSTNFSEPWANSRNSNDEEFIELDHEFNSNWQLNASATRTTQYTKALEPDFQGSVDSEGNGFLYLGANYSDLRSVQYALDAHVNGAFEMFGQTQKILVGADYQNAGFNFIGLQQTLGYGFGVPVNLFKPDLSKYSANPGIPDPATDPNGGITYDENTPNSQYGLYANLMLEPIKGLHLNGGFRYSNYFESANSDINEYFFGFPFGEDTITKDSYRNIVTPSASIVYDISKLFSVYFSYADIFDPSGAHVTASGSLLAPEQGKTFEGGVKFVSPNGKLNASLAAFSAEQRNVPLQATYGASLIGGDCCYVANAGQTNSGVEFQVSGELTKGWQVNAGYTYLNVSYNRVYEDYLNGSTQFPFSSTQQPRHQAKLWTSYALPWVQGLTVLGGLRVDSARDTVGLACPTFVAIGYCPVNEVPFSFTQPLYAVADLGAQYQVNKHWLVGVNVNNLTDTRYYATAGTESAYNFYGEPRKVMVFLRATY